MLLLLPHINSHNEVRADRQTLSATCAMAHPDASRAQCLHNYSPSREVTALATENPGCTYHHACCCCALPGAAGPTGSFCCVLRRLAALTMVLPKSLQLPISALCSPAHLLNSRPFSQLRDMAGTTANYVDERERVAGAECRPDDAHPREAGTGRAGRRSFVRTPLRLVFEFLT